MLVDFVKSSTIIKNHKEWDKAEMTSAQGKNSMMHAKTIGSKT